MSMKREYHRWHSPRLGIELGVVVYGHWGPPLLGFPTSAGDEWELESQGMIGYLVHGGNSGVRILNEQAHAIPGVDDHLPNGYGRPIIWIAEEDAGDLPTEVQMLVNPQ